MPSVGVYLSRDKYPHPYPPRDNELWVCGDPGSLSMSVRFHRGGWEARWRDAEGRDRGRRFASEEAARAFEEALAEVSPSARRSDTAPAGSWRRRLLV